MARGTSGLEMRLGTGGQVKALRGGSTTLAFSNVSITAGQWHMLAITKDGTTLGTKIYIDGGDVTSGLLADTLTNGGGSVRLGDLPYATGVLKYSGLMDEVAVWNVALTAAHVSTLYQEGLETIGTPGNTLYPIEELLLDFQTTSTNINTARGFVDIAIGPTGSEQVIIENLGIHADGATAEWISQNFIGPLPVQIPAGTQIQARYQTNDIVNMPALDLTIYGVS